MNKLLTEQETFLAVMDIMDNWYHAATRRHLIDVDEAKPMIDKVVNFMKEQKLAHADMVLKRYKEENE